MLEGLDLGNPPMSEGEAPQVQLGSETKVDRESTNPNVAAESTSLSPRASKAGRGLQYSQPRSQVWTPLNPPPTQLPLNQGIPFPSLDFAWLEERCITTDKSCHWAAFER